MKALLYKFSNFQKNFPGWGPFLVKLQIAGLQICQKNGFVADVFLGNADTPWTATYDNLFISFNKLIS